MEVGKLALEGIMMIFEHLPEGCSDIRLLVEHRAMYTRKEKTSFNTLEIW